MISTPDPFREARETSLTLPVDVNGETIPLLLRMQDIRKACKNTGDFSSANPFHITLEPETRVRSYRQFPIESDPPEHTDYRAIVEPLFRRPEQPAYAARIEELVRRAVTAALEAGELEVVRDFALPLQSRALTLLLGLPESEAETWISWGVHVFHDGDGGQKGKVLEAYTAAQFERAAREPGEDFFSVLNQARFQGRPLSFEEKQGFANLAFAGGRDTVIGTVTRIFAEAANDPKLLPGIRATPDLADSAVEEIVRITTPLTAISRTCPHDTAVQKAGGRIGLCWASANREERFFPEPDRFQADRNPNPHVGFGFGPHNCLGAPHARLLLRTLFRILAEQDVTLRIQTQELQFEQLGTVTRPNGFQRLRIKITKQL